MAEITAANTAMDLQDSCTVLLKIGYGKWKIGPYVIVQARAFSLRSEYHSWD